ncbi:unnamed protein product, partial [Rotaria sordida]
MTSATSLSNVDDCESCVLCLSKYNRIRPSFCQCKHCSIPLCMDCMKEHHEEVLQDVAQISHQYNELKELLEMKQKMIVDETTKSIEDVNQYFKTYINELLETQEKIILDIEKAKQDAQSYVLKIDSDLRIVGIEIQGLAKQRIAQATKTKNLSTELKSIEQSIKKYQTIRTEKTSFIIILYLLYKKKSSTLLIDKNDYHYHFDNYHFEYENNSILTNINVIPFPQFIDKKNSVLIISNGFRIISKQNSTKDLRLALRRYSKYISLLAGISVEINQTFLSSENKLIIDCPLITSPNNTYPKLGEDESYTLNITKTGSYLYSLSLTGIIRGLSTFVQLIQRNASSDTFYIPLVNIIDRPRFIWRGLLLDVSRHWMPVSVIRRTLNTMELSKFNVLHLHLSDDQGFRVESIEHHLLYDRKYFFSQNDIEYLVEYARQRRIRIIPEFDMPGHTTSWFVGYPELASQPGPYQIATRWGVMKATMDPTKENT